MKNSKFKNTRVLFGLLVLGLVVTGATAAVLSNMLTANMTVTTEMPIALSFTTEGNPSGNVAIGEVKNFVSTGEIGTFANPLAIDWVLSIEGPAGFLPEHVIIRLDGNTVIVANGEGKYHIRQETITSGQGDISLYFSLEFLWGTPSGAYSFNLEVVGDWA